MIGGIYLKLLRQLGIIVGVCFAGEFLNTLLGIPIPGNVLGMILLLLLLSTEIVNLEMIDEISKFLLGYLPFFFIPAGVNLLTNLEMMREQWLGIMGVIIISTILVMVVTGITIQFLQRRQRV